MKSPIDRRQFALRSALWGGALALPAWLRRAFAPQDPAAARPDARLIALRAAIARAKARRRPLLVAIVPADQNLAWVRGQQLGAFLNHTGREGLLDLALADGACATAEELQKAIPSAKVADEAWLALVDPNDERPAAVAIAPDLSDLGPEPPYDGKIDWAVWQEQLRERASKIVAATALALREAIAKDPAALAERADRNRETLTADERRRIAAFLAGDGELDQGLVLAAAAVLRMAAAAPRRAGDAERILGAVEVAARAVWVTAPVPGSRWAHSSGCGVSFEGQDDADRLAIACGMGSVPPLSSRFLHFFAL